MIVISAKDITKEYGVDKVLDQVSFHINKGERVGLIGANGAGKTTLLKILAGELSHEEGDVFIAQDTTIGYLKQKDPFISSKTIMEEVESIFVGLKEMEGQLLDLSHQAAKSPAGSKEQEILLNRHHQLMERFKELGGYTYKSEATGILTSMAFTKDQYDTPVSTLSGGERTRLSLAMLLLKKPDILFLDEPTNHLDIGTLRWLEQYLRGYKGTIVLVSHDRYFLDRTVTRVFEIENQRLEKYEGNYTRYAEEKRMRRIENQRRQASLKKEVDKQEEIIRRFKGHGTEKLAKRAASREKKLAKTMAAAQEQGLDQQIHTGQSHMKIRFKEKYQSGKDVLVGEDISKSYGYGSNRKAVFEGVNIDIKRGDRICLVGPNGIGKTTLMKILMEDIDRDTGYVKRGHNVKFGYYDQGQLLLNDTNTVIEELHDCYSTYTQTELRTILGSFLFHGDQVFLEVGSLSGGEKARLSLLKLMLGGANVLLLDEPTNHLDIQSKEVFEEALLDFPGAVIIISHDRYLLSRVPTKIMELGRTGLTTFLGTYDYYVEKKQEMESGKQYLANMAMENKVVTTEKEEDEGPKLNPAAERRLKKEEEARLRRQERERQRLEEEIEETEAEISQLEETMCTEKVLVDHVLLTELDSQVSVLKEKLTSIYEKWLQYEEP